MADRPAQLEEAERQEKPYDANDIEQVTEARKKSGRKRKEKRDDYASLLETEKGRGFLWDFCAAAVNFDPLVPNDPYSSYFNFGQMKKAKDLFVELLRTAPELTAQMVKENMDK